MYSDNKQIRDVADVAARIMSGQQPVTEKLHPNQQKLDVHEPEKDELTADDFKKLRAKKEVKKEEVEELDEVKMADLPSTKIQGRAYGASKPEPHAVDTLKGPKEKELKDIEAEKKKKKFSEMVNLYQEKGLKSLSEMLVKEEPDNEQFTKELEDAKAKSEGKKRNTEIAKGAVQAVKQEGTEITDEMIFEVLENAGIDFESLDDDELQVVANEAYEILDELSKDTLNSYVKKSFSDKEKDNLNTPERQKGLRKATSRLYKEEVELDEREMTDAEMKKREDIVKGMKKGMAGFKERYGDRAKNVMYATANKQAMKD